MDRLRDDAHRARYILNQAENGRVEKRRRRDITRDEKMQHAVESYDVAASPDAKLKWLRKVANL